MGSHRDLGVLYTHPLEYGTIRPLYLYEEQAASLLDSVVYTEVKKKVGPPNIDSRNNLFVLKVFKTHKQVPSGHKWLALYSYYHTSLECLLHT